MNGFPGSRVRIAAVLTLVVGAVVLLLTYRGYHERRLLLGGVYLLTAAGVLAQLFWLMRYRLLWIASLTVAYAFMSPGWWAKGEMFSVVCGGAVVVFGVVQFFRGLRYKEQLKDARKWPLTKGGFSGNYEDGEGRVIYYGYQV